MADEAKAKGNAAFAAGNFTDAVSHFTEAINLATSNHVLYSNRSAAYASLNKFSEALSDAEKTVELKPDWSKGYSRLGAAHMGLHSYNDAVSAYKKGLEIDPNNEPLKSGLADAEAALARSSRSRAGPGADLFGEAFGPEMWVKLANDPTTRGYWRHIGYIFLIILIIYLYSKGEFKMWDTKETILMNHESVKPLEVANLSLDEQEFGVVATGQKQIVGSVCDVTSFNSEIVTMDDCVERLFVHACGMEACKHESEYEDCIKDCDKAVERGRELRSDFKMIARALTRKGSALVKVAKCSKDYEPAVETFHKALTEHRNPDTLKKLNDAEKAKKELEQQEYFDPKIADEEREKGNQYFKEQNYPEAVKHYTESLKRNPKDPKAYSNRAACYTKLGALPEGLKDAEKCIELDPRFAKGYTRKGAVQFFMKEYEKALETYQEGLRHDPQNPELLDGVRRCVEQINKASRGDLSPEELKERQAKGMQDPEIQNILKDPVMQQVLVDLQENPKAAQDHMRNPLVMNKIQKLVSAGIVQMR
ncbi:hsp70-Hsp90 organizing 3-like [Olea europaea subsp. europaea]|uniref:Hsp70-Hsp90 organizing 3-like n=1 Tax=Olea europaea subsp. europaea TaxID=158383 RepID=A0A8S0SSY2_OLEEU|nr:hsp70-Hsp90 organizing 3-like [Olea europaea subsp. europaea]